jgi:hypothetical protein
MAVFDSKSRYEKNASTYEVTDRRGRTVAALTAADKPVQTLLGEHLRKEGQRLDHVANFYLNDAMLPDAVAETDTLKIPTVL